jgi:2-haloalkanoic acid dehalogenase type II
MGYISVRAVNDGESTSVTRFQLRNFEAILFDLDSTLTDTHMYPARATTWVLEQSVDNVHEVREEYLRVLVDNYFLGVDSIVKGAEYQPPYELVRTAIRKSLEHVRANADSRILDEGTDYFKRLHIEMSTLNEGVKDLLNELRSLGIKLGVVTNSFEGHSPQILEKLGISSYFESMVDGGDVSAYKPMKKPFQLALNELDAKPEESAFVGDEFYADIVGAKEVGMTTVWINTRDKKLDALLLEYGSEYTPDLVIDEIGMLKGFI